MGFHRVNVSFTDMQMRMLLLEANATGLKIGTIVRMLIHDDIATGRAVRHHRMKEAERKLQNAAVIAAESE